MTIFPRPGSWHDGNPFVADDVVFTVRALQDPFHLISRIGEGSLDTKSGKHRPSDREIVFREPQMTPQDKLTFKILPSHRFTQTAIRHSDPFHTPTRWGRVHFK